MSGHLVLVVVERFDMSLVERILDRGVDRGIEWCLVVDLEFGFVEWSFIVRPSGLPGGRG